MKPTSARFPSNAQPAERGAPAARTSPSAPGLSGARCYSATVLRLRRWQIRAVVIGVCSGLVWLLALALRWIALAYCAFAVVLAAWLTIPLLGVCAIYRTRYPARKEPV